MSTEDYLRAPRVIDNPDPKVYGASTRRFEGIPGIERAASGRLWATWYGGTGPEEDRYNHVLVATRADGGEWADLTLVIDPDGDGPVRAFDPCLWHDPTGRLWLFWAQGYEKHTDERSGVWAITTRNSDDAAPDWTEPRRLCDGIMMNKPIATSSGEWLLPVARWRREGSAKVYASDDEGDTWTLRGEATVPRAEDRNCDEHMIVELNDERLWMLVRTSYGIGQSLSDDGGRTWPDVAPTSLAHVASRFFVRRLRSGRLLLVKHGSLRECGSRSHLTAFLSEDDGASWTGGLLLDERDGVSYPDGVEGDDGTLYIIYDYDRRGARAILTATFTEEDVRDSAIASTGAPQRVNKAGK